MTTEITKQELNRLAVCEATIKKTRGAFVECGKALMEIRDSKLYRNDFKNFEDYCQTKWGWSRQHSHNLIESSVVVEGLPSNLSTMVDNSRSARELAKVDPSKRADILKKLKKIGAEVTSKTIKDEAKKEKVIEVDGLGHPIPDDFLDDWNRAKQVGSELTGLLSDVKCTLDNGLIEKDCVFAELTNTTVAAVKNVYTQCKLIVPYCVCPYCQGRSRSKCTFCSGRGFISEFRFKAVPVELRQSWGEK